MLNMEGRTKRLIIPFIVFISLFCCLPRCIVWLLNGQPAPAPVLYPGVEPTVVYQSPGSCCQSQGHFYTVDTELPKIQSYYEAQLVLFCKDDWEFKALPEKGYREHGLYNLSFYDLSFYKATEGCRFANCEIRRLSRDQWFSVVLCADEPTQTFVIQWNTWED
jgi:hypothetical protein